MVRGSLHFLRVQLQQNMTGFGFQLGLQHNACVVRLPLSGDFSGSLFSCRLFTAVVSRERFFFLSVINVLKCSEVQYFKLNILK